MPKDRLPNSPAALVAAALLLGLLSASASAQDPAHWLKDPSEAATRLIGLCTPGVIGGTGERQGFGACDDGGAELGGCAWSFGTDDEGGDRYLVNPVGINGMNAVLYDKVCIGGDHCGAGVNFGRVMLLSGRWADEVLIWEGYNQPETLVPC